MFKSTRNHLVSPTSDFLLYCNGSKPKPILRGLMHEIAFLLTPIWATPILMICKSWISFISCLAFVFSMAFCYGASSQYHRREWGLHQEIMMHRLDSAGIFVMVAFNSTPVFLLLIPQSGIIVMLLMTICCGIGIFLSFNLPPENHVGLTNQFFG
jgi:hemolysin III